MSVYFAAVGDYVKIGYSRNPMARAGTITRSGSRPDDIPFAADVDLLGWVPGDSWREGQIHGRFLDQRVKGEWFRLTPEDVTPIIWADPRGVDIHNMSAWAVLTCCNQPELTRDDLAAAGIPVMARPLTSGFGADWPGVPA